MYQDTMTYLLTKPVQITVKKYFDQFNIEVYKIYTFVCLRLSVKKHEEVNKLCSASIDGQVITYITNLTFLVEVTSHKPFLGN